MSDTQEQETHRVRIIVARAGRILFSKHGLSIILIRIGPGYPP